MSRGLSLDDCRLKRIARRKRLIERVASGSIVKLSRGGHETLSKIYTGNAKLERLIKACYEKTRKKNYYDPRTYATDHVIPLRNPLVCGLTVPLNLKTVKFSANASKKASWNQAKESEKQLQITLVQIKKHT